jgi:hypothetical protein
MRVLRQPVLVPSPYAYQEASWLVLAGNGKACQRNGETGGCNEKGGWRYEKARAKNFS